MTSPRDPLSADARLERIETRLCKLMTAAGLDPSTGEPARADHAVIYDALPDYEGDGGYRWRVFLSNDCGSGSFQTKDEALAWARERSNTQEVL